MNHLTAKTVLLTIWSCLVLGSGLRAWQQVRPAQKPWVVDDVVEAESVSAFDLSADGTSLAWVRTQADRKKDRYVGHLFMLRFGDGRKRQLTFGADGVSAPRFSPDGKRIAYLTTRKPAGVQKPPKGAQVWILPLDGGEPRPVTTFEGGVRVFRWRSDGALIVSARERKSPEERRAEERKDKTVVVEDRSRFEQAAVRLFEVEVKADDSRGKIRRLTRNDDRITTFEVSPDGRRVVFVRQVSPTSPADARQPPGVFVQDLESGDKRELFAEQRNRPTAFTWQTDAARLFALVPESSVDGESTAAILHPFVIDPGTGSATRIDVAYPRGLSRSGLIGMVDGFVALQEDGVNLRPVRYSAREGRLDGRAHPGRAREPHLRLEQGPERGHHRLRAWRGGRSGPLVPRSPGGSASR